MKDFPFEPVAERLVNTWRAHGTRLYANWLSEIQAQEAIAVHDETVAIHGGYTPDSTRAVAVPIYQTIAHEFDDAAHAGAVFDLEMPGFHYNRLNNPTNDVLEHRLAALERRHRCRRRSAPGRPRSTTRS